MPIGGSTINGCDCPGTSPASGVLIDGIIPSIDTTQQGWARELFTVNKNGQDSFMIGFQFSHFLLREVKILLFNCPVQGIGITGVKIYSSFLFPTFTSGPASSLLATYNSPPSDNCLSLSTVTISVQPPMEFNSYFVEFLFTGESSMHPLNWLHLGEIRFSDMVPGTVSETTTENEGKL
jgi:hypothetical protein